MGKPPIDEWVYPLISKFITQRFSCSQENRDKNKAETEGRAIWGLPHLGIHPFCTHQTWTLFLFQEVLAERNLVPWEVRPATDEFRCGFLEPIIRLGLGTLVGIQRKNCWSWVGGCEERGDLFAINWNEGNEGTAKAFRNKGNFSKHFSKEVDFNQSRKMDVGDVRGSQLV